jgi:hypothetical protein
MNKINLFFSISILCLCNMTCLIAMEPPIQPMEVDSVKQEEKGREKPTINYPKPEFTDQSVTSTNKALVTATLAGEINKDSKVFEYLKTKKNKTKQVRKDLSNRIKNLKEIQDANEFKTQCGSVQYDINASELNMADKNDLRKYLNSAIAFRSMVSSKKANS